MDAFGAAKLIRFFLFLFFFTIASLSGEALTPNQRVIIQSANNWVLSGFKLPNGVDCYFAKALYYGNCTLTVTRASAGTSLLPTSAAGASFLTFGNNVARLVPGSGLRVEEARTNLLTNSCSATTYPVACAGSTGPATQTTGNLGTTGQVYTLWVNGSGSATMSTGSATGCGTGVAIQGTPATFTLTGTGTCVVTVAGSLNAFQLELNPGTVSAPTSLIITADATATRAADVVTLTNPPPFGSAYTLFAAGTPDAPVTYTTVQEFISINDGTGNNRSEMTRASASGNFGVFGDAGGASFWNSSFTPALAAATAAKIASSWAPSAQSLVANGGPVHTNSTGTPISSPTITQVNIGLENSQRYYNGTLSRIAIAPTVALPAATLQAVTNLNQYNFLLRRDFGPSNDNVPVWFLREVG